MQTRSLILLTAWIFAAFAAQAEKARAETAVEQRFEALRDDPLLLRRFLLRFPKGGDLHNHLDGAIYAESYIAWAAEDGKCVDLPTAFILPPPCNTDASRPPLRQVQLNADIVNPLIDALSVRNYERRTVSGHNQFFSTFRRFRQASFGREGDMLAEVAARAVPQNLLYLELMQSWGMDEARALGRTDQAFDPDLPVDRLRGHPGIEQLVRQSVSAIDTAEARMREKLGCDDAGPACDTTIRYLSQVIRTFPRRQVLAQTLLAVSLIERDPRVVGLNFVAPEDNPVSLRDHTWQMQMIGALARQFPGAAAGITLHAGELALGLVAPEHLGRHIREAIELAGASRIGHGVDIVHDRDAESLLREMSERGVMVEINLTSNDVILGVAGERHPFDLYRRYDVPLALSTDDEGVSRIDLTHEYQRAVETYDIDYRQLRTMSRNSLLYSFLDAREKAELLAELERRFAAFEASFE